MARIRSLKPELLDDERVAEMSDAAFRLFIGAILVADDYGNLKGATRYLTGRVFWGRVESGDHAAEVLGELTAPTPDGKPGILQEYEHHGQKYLAITNWERHQKVDHRKKRGLMPPPPWQNQQLDLLSSENPRANSEDSENFGESSKTVAPDQDQEGTRTRTRTGTRTKTGTGGCLDYKELSVVFISALNLRTGRKYKYSTYTVHRDAKLIVKRIREHDAKLVEAGEEPTGLSTDEVRALVDMKYEEWHTSDKFAKRLTPTTLLKPDNFLNYLSDLRSGEGTRGPEPSQLAFDEVLDQVSKVGRYDKPKFTEPRTRAAVKAVGWANLCTMDESKLRATFMAAWRKAGAK